MADRRRVVTMSSGGRPVVLADLEISGTYQAIQDTFAYGPGQRNQQMSREPGRYGGSQSGGEQLDNGTVTWQALVRGATADVVAANVEAMLTQAEADSRDRLLEWRPDGSSFSSYFRIAGPGEWKPTYSWRQWAGAQSMLVDITFPVRPLVLWDPMTIRDDFSVDSNADYTYDALTSANAPITGGVMTASGSLTSERRARHTVRGYKVPGGQATLKFTPVTTITSFKAGVLLRGSSSSTYVEVYVDDNGTNSRLRIDVVIAGVRTNRQSTNLAARIITATPGWVRGRIEGNNVIAEYFTSAPGTPTLAPAAYALIAGEQTSLVDGFSGWSWIPQNASATLDDFAFVAYAFANQTQPTLLALGGSIPGTAPALMDVSVGNSGADTAWGLIGWGSSRLLQSFDSTAAATRAGFTENAKANALGGTISSSTVAGPSTGIVEFNWPVALAELDADDFADASADIEIWVRVYLTSGLVNPRLEAYFKPLGANLAGRRFTNEWGSAGAPITVPSSSGFRMVRAGVITVDVTDGMPIPRLGLSMSVDAGSTTEYGVDYALVVPARHRAAGPTGVPLDGSFPSILPSTGVPAIKTVRSDLSGRLAPDGSPGVAHHGLGGALIQPPPGPLSMLVKLSDAVPDNPDPANAGESASFVGATGATGISLDVTPRSYLLRSA